MAVIIFYCCLLFYQSYKLPSLLSPPTPTATKNSLLSTTTNTYFSNERRESNNTVLVTTSPSGFHVARLPRSAVHSSPVFEPLGPVVPQILGCSLLHPTIVQPGPSLGHSFILAPSISIFTQTSIWGTPTESL